MTPQNVAIAINENCTSCETLASAYQWVLGTDEENVRFSPEGRLAINEIGRSSESSDGRISRSTSCRRGCNS